MKDSGISREPLKGCELKISNLKRKSRLGSCYPLSPLTSALVHSIRKDKGQEVGSFSAKPASTLITSPTRPI